MSARRTSTTTERRPSRSGLCAALLAAMAVVLSPMVLPAPAAAQGRAIFGLGVEVVGAMPVDSENKDRFGFGGGGAIDAELNAHPMLGLHGGLAALMFGAADNPNGTEWYGLRGGARFHWADAIGVRDDDGWLDLHFNYGSSAGVQSGGFDAGIGYELSVADGFRVGPMVRYHFGLDPDDTSVHYVTFGVSFGLLGHPRRGVGDSDGDGVEDAKDICPSTPQGASPDPYRPGCPGLDGDGDGVMDRDDHCPDVAMGASPDPRPQRKGCPAGDVDGDGVGDDIDQCPDKHKGPAPDESRPGCPGADRDGDSIADAVDKCPDEVGAPSPDPEKNGCPGLVQVKEGKIEILTPVYFKSGSDQILAKSEGVLTAVADSIRQLGIKRIRIEGHTDNAGPADRNDDLSLRRAQAVLRWLVDHGVEPAGLEAMGFGESRPIADNKTKNGRAKNRRVEFYILDSAFQGK